MGAAHIVQTESGLRASELLGIQEEHVDATDATTPITIALGLKTSTKAKRLQAVIIRYEKHPTSHLLLRMLKATTPKCRKIFPYSFAQYNGGVQLIDLHLHLNLQSWSSTFYLCRLSVITPSYCRHVPAGSAGFPRDWKHYPVFPVR